VDHVGYLARDLEEAVAEVAALLGVEITRRFERPEFSVVGVYLGSGEGSIEVFSFTEPELQSQRLRGERLLLDHVAYAVKDIDAVAAAMRHSGVRFSGPDLRGELEEPVALGGARHLWTIPQTSLGQSIQLLQR
jgi:catechol 2,3-dioxygenase-like lactoylglutathione lyase family enzyme